MQCGINVVYYLFSTEILSGWLQPPRAVSNGPQDEETPANPSVPLGVALHPRSRASLRIRHSGCHVQRTDRGDRVLEPDGTGNLQADLDLSFHEQHAEGRTRRKRVHCHHHGKRGKDLIHLNISGIKNSILFYFLTKKATIEEKLFFRLCLYRTNCFMGMAMILPISHDIGSFRFSRKTTLA